MFGTRLGKAEAITKVEPIYHEIVRAIIDITSVSESMNPNPNLKP